MTARSPADPRWSALLAVAQRLGDLRDRVLFLGGAVVPLLVTDPGATDARPTKDIDLSIEIATLIEYHQLGQQLRDLDFAEDDEPGAPTCRWVVAGLKVDVMPTEGRVLGYTNSWFRAAMKDPLLVSFADGHALRVVSGPYFCATKLEAFADRGGGDFTMSSDIEDVIAVVDGRSELIDEVRSAEPTVRSCLASTFDSLTRTDAFIDALPGHLPGDSASQARLPLLVDRLRALAGA